MQISLVRSVMAFLGRGCTCLFDKYLLVYLVGLGGDFLLCIVGQNSLSSALAEFRAQMGFTQQLGQVLSQRSTITFWEYDTCLAYDVWYLTAV
jgi:hypothetical protein